MRILATILALFLSLAAFAACPDVANSAGYVLKGATGTGTGADWTNACTDFSGSVCGGANLQRGCTYYVGTGAYTGGYTFNATASGSTLITVLGATAATHGIATGWSNSFGVDVTQATFSTFPNFTTSHWRFDGAIGSGTTVGNYGFKMANGLDTGFVVGALNSTGSGITVSHITALADAANNEKLFLQTANQTNEWDNIAVSHSLLNGWQNCMMLRGNPGVTDVGWILEYNQILNMYSNTVSNHGECMNPNSANSNGMIVRFNVIRGNSGTDGLTGVIVANNSDNNNAVVYGNVFDGILAGNGIITGTSSGNLNNASIYNNSFLNYQSPSGAALCGSGQGTGNVAQNNLFWNYDGTVGSGCANDYNAYYSGTNNPTETHGQIASGNPFTNSAAFVYTLTADTNAGNSLSSSLPSGCTVGVNCYNVDLAGTLRAANGTWDRGALQITGNTPTVTPAPSLGMFAELLFSRFVH